MAKPPEKDDPHRQIPLVTEGKVREIFDWLETLFNISPRDTKPGKVKTEPDAMPDRIVLRTIFGRGGADHGPDITSETWKPMVSPQPSRERLGEIANKFHARAETDVRALGKPQRYGLFAYSNLKGSSYYERFLFTMSPTGKDYSESEVMSRSGPASDDEDTHRDRLLSTALAHSRWKDEQTMEAIQGVLKLQQEIIKQQAETIARQDAERRAWIITSEEALSKKQEREIQAQWASAKVSVLTDMWSSVRGLLPGVVAYVTKGKAGIVEGLKAFFEGLSPEARNALFGVWADPKTRTQAGILDEEQVHLFVGIVDGRVEASKLKEFIASLRQEQMIAAQSVLTPQQIQTLVGLASAAGESGASQQQQAAAQ